jgi:hypothetical protein
LGGSAKREETDDCKNDGPRQEAFPVDGDQTTELRTGNKVTPDHILLQSVLPCGQIFRQPGHKDLILLLLFDGQLLDHPVRHLHFQNHGINQVIGIGIPERHNLFHNGITSGAIRGENGHCRLPQGGLFRRRIFRCVVFRHNQISLRRQA